MSKPTSTLPAPSAPTPEQLAAYLSKLAELGHHAKAAAAAGVSLDAIRALARADRAFRNRRDIAKEAHAEAVADALIEEAVLGREVRDPINDRVQRVRNLRLLERLAVKLGILDPERPAVAIQNNVGAGPAQPASVEALPDDLAAELRRRLLPRAAEIVDAEIVEPAPEGSDLL